MLSCSACNQRHKRNHFPLANPQNRAGSHTADVTLESALLLQPAQHDPEQFIGFRKEIPFAIDGDQKAQTTIRALGLNREILNELRRERLAELIRLRQLVALEEQLSASADGRRVIKDVKTFLAKAVTEAAEFAAMTRAAAKADFYISLF